MCLPANQLFATTAAETTAKKIAKYKTFSGNTEIAIDDARTCENDRNERRRER